MKIIDVEVKRVKFMRALPDAIDHHRVIGFGGKRIWIKTQPFVAAGDQLGGSVRIAIWQIA